ncbi:MAG TPA: hypothetical protein VKB86_19195 [Pyrinomonadaceae bacterium]|nr:hypothetical protein [Pyrinomonadaceae bacterium]
MPKLIIKPNPNRSPSNPGHYHIYLRADDGKEERRQLVGFSYFGEVGGLRMIPKSDYVVLDQYNGSSDWTQAISCSSNSTAIRMSYEQWFDLLATHSINFSRVFVYPDVEPACYPFDRTADGKQYDLNAPGSLYLTLLERYITYAQRRNIIVQISLAGIQTLRPAKWAFHPMNAAAKLNVNGYLDTLDGRKKFCIIMKPDAAADTEPEWNYQTQSEALDWILNVSSWAWNVVYELFNEPGGTIDHADGQINWLVTMVKWLDERLRDPETGGHTHLITLNSGPTLLAPDGSNILKRMLFDAQGKRRAHPLVDVFSFHGSQWGGDSAGPTRPGPNGNPPLSPDVIGNATRNAVNSFYSRPIDADNNVVQGSPVALICDSDAHYRAQDSPAIYGRVVLKDLQLDYNHRWSSFWLSQSKLCGQVEGVQNAALKIGTK